MTIKRASQWVLWSGGAVVAAWLVLLLTARAATAIWFMSLIRELNLQVLVLALIWIGAAVLAAASVWQAWRALRQGRSRRMASWLVVGTIGAWALSDIAWRLVQLAVGHAPVA